MRDAEVRKVERKAAEEMNRRLRFVAGALPCGVLRRVYNYRLADAETRRLVRAEAKRRGYRMGRFGG